MGSDTRRSARRPKGCHFNPRSPDGERPGPCHPAACSSRYFNPRSPDGERRRQPRRQPRPLGISIHAPRMGSDCSRCPRPPSAGYFNPRSPDGERRGCVWATNRRSWHFNPRSPDGERPERLSPMIKDIIISIHAPRMGSDDLFELLDAEFPQFQSTLPGWGATPLTYASCICQNISIHAPRMGSDIGADGTIHQYVSISIHAPRMGSDPESMPSDHALSIFQSTLPGWGATVHPPRLHVHRLISIHAPRMGSDPMRRGYGLGCWNFNPRSPDGERRPPRR